MKPTARRRPGLRGRGLRRPIPITIILAALAAAALGLAAAGCGSSSGGTTPATGGQAGVPTAMQVLYTVQRGDLVQTAAGQAKVLKAKGTPVVVATVSSQSAAAVAAGQKATVMLFAAGANGQGGFPQGGASGAPSGMPVPQGGASGAPVPQGGESGAPFPQTGQSGAPFPQSGSGSDLARRGTSGMVTAIKMNSDGTAAATITLDTRPTGITAASAGMAVIQTKVLASNVILVPTAAIKGSGSSATVQVVSGGTTTTRPVVVGQQSGFESEITSGLNVGENIVYTRSFSRGQFGTGGGFPGQGQGGTGGSQSGSESGGGFQ